MTDLTDNFAEHIKQQVLDVYGIAPMDLQTDPPRMARTPWATKAGTAELPDRTHFRGVIDDVLFWVDDRTDRLWGLWDRVPWQPLLIAAAFCAVFAWNRLHR